MVKKLSDIPAEIRWDIATKCADAIPFAYDRALRQIAADKPEEIEQAEREIWKNIGKSQGQIAKELGYTANNALEVAEAINELSTTMFGPELKGEAEQSQGDSAILVIKKCPLVKNTKRFNKDPRESCTLCNAFFIAAGENLNSKYRIDFDKHICMGDAFCQMQVSKK